MRFLQSAVGALRPTVSGETDVMGTDGKLLFASPTWLLNTFIQNKVWINRMYLHELLHCLFCHLWNRKVKEESDRAKAAEKAPLQSSWDVRYSLCPQRHNSRSAICI